jgi:hypothetical protein
MPRQLSLPPRRISDETGRVEPVDPGSAAGGERN